jgi:hypothetical protein
MSAIVPFESQQLPAHIAAFDVGSDDLISGVSSGFPVLSIKGKVFHISRGDSNELVTLPNSEDPAASIEVVVLKANKNVSKIFYAKKYEEGSTEKPDCYSNDGIAPAADAQTPQSKKCVTCPHNQWGSRITDSGVKAKSCSDHRRLAVAPSGQLNDPMLIRVPATSLKPLADFGELLKKRGVKYPSVITKIGFDHSVSHPSLTFKPVAFVPTESVTLIKETLDSEIVRQIIGTSDVGEPVTQPTGRVAAEAPAMPKAEEPPPAPEAPPAEVKAEAPKPKAAAKKAAAPTPPPAPITVSGVDGLEDELEKALEMAGLDD